MIQAHQLTSHLPRVGYVQGTGLRQGLWRDEGGARSTRGRRRLAHDRRPCLCTRAYGRHVHAHHLPFRRRKVYRLSRDSADSPEDRGYTENGVRADGDSNPSKYLDAVQQGR
jgi:hypothetical protein